MSKHTNITSVSTTGNPDADLQLNVGKTVADQTLLTRFLQGRDLSAENTHRMMSKEPSKVWTPAGAFRANIVVNSAPSKAVEPASITAATRMSGIFQPLPGTKPVFNPNRLIPASALTEVTEATQEQSSVGSLTK